MKRVGFDNGLDGFSRFVGALESQEAEDPVIGKLGGVVSLRAVQTIEHGQGALVIGGQIELAHFRQRVLVCINGTGRLTGQPDQQADDHAATRQGFPI